MPARGDGRKPANWNLTRLGAEPDKERLEGRGPSPEDALRTLALRMKELEA